jgi:hypothetical protein
MFPFSSRSQAKALVRIASREGKRHRLNDQSGSQILAHHSLLMLAVLMLVTQMLAPSNTTRSFSFLWLLTSIVYGPHRRLQQFPAKPRLSYISTSTKSDFEIYRHLEIEQHPEPSYTWIQRHRGKRKSDDEVTTANVRFGVNASTWIEYRILHIL